MGSYFDDSCTSPVLCTLNLQNSCFKIGGETLVSHATVVPVSYRTLYHVFAALFTLQQECNLPYPLHFIMHVRLEIGGRALRHSSANWCVGSACHAREQLLEASSCKFMLSSSAPYMTKRIMNTVCWLVLLSD